MLAHTDIHNDRRYANKMIRVSHLLFAQYIFADSTVLNGLFLSVFLNESNVT